MILPDFDAIDVPDDVLAFPSMITSAEKSLLYWLAKTHFNGVGHIVDAGAFLGGSTYALGRGLQDNPQTDAKAGTIRSFDIAIWVASMDRYLQQPNVVKAIKGDAPRTGESFAPLLKRLIAPLGDIVTLELGDIIKTASVPGPVEIAFYDCMKTNARDRAAFQAFAPNYIPGHTIVLQQDYFHEGAAYNKIRQEYYSHSFSYLGRVSTTGIFQMTKAIAAKQFDKDYVSALPLAEKTRLLRQAAQRTRNPKLRVLTDLSVAEFLIDEGTPDLARTELDAIQGRVDQLHTDQITRRPQTIIDGLRRRLNG